MQRFFILFLGLCITTSVIAAEPDESEKADSSAQAIKILKKCADALKEVKYAEYDANYKGTSWAKAYVPDVVGAGKIGVPSELKVERFQCKAKVTPIGSEETVDITAGCDGNTYYVIDASTEKVYADIDPAVMGSKKRDPRVILLQDFVSDNPLENELKQTQIQLGEPEKVGEELCYQVKVKMTDSQAAETIICVSQKDYLPRRIVRVYLNRQGEKGTTEMELSNLVVGSKCDPKKFKLEVPKGFTKTDDFAP